MEDPSDDSQPQGFYPRVNGKSLETGQYANMIVSLVGHFLPTPNADGTVPFKASDGGIISVTPEQVEMPLIGPDSPPFEIIGQAMGPADLFVRIVVGEHCCVSSAASQYGALVPQMVTSQPHTTFLARCASCFRQLFCTRELTKDTDLETYDKMLEVQANPKFASYFSPVPAAGRA
jgi:hypothetical protein